MQMSETSVPVNGTPVIEEAKGEPTLAKPDKQFVPEKYLAHLNVE